MSFPRKDLGKSYTIILCSYCVTDCCSVTIGARIKQAGPCGHDPVSLELRELRSTSCGVSCICPRTANTIFEASGSKLTRHGNFRKLRRKSLEKCFVQRAQLTARQNSEVWSIMRQVFPFSVRDGLRSMVFFGLTGLSFRRPDPKLRSDRVQLRPKFCFGMPRGHGIQAKLIWIAILVCTPAFGVKRTV